MSSVIWTTPGEVQKVVEALRHERGEFSLAMLYNEDGLSVTGWNLIVSARWTDKLGRAEAIGILTHALSQSLGLENKQTISRVTVLPTGDDFVRAITSRYQVASPGAGQWIQNTLVAGIPVGAAFVFYSQAEPPTD